VDIEYSNMHKFTPEFKKAHEFKEVPYDALYVEKQMTKLSEELDTPTKWEMIIFLVKNAFKILEIVYNIYQLINGVKEMNPDKKTTILGYLKSTLILLLTIFASTKIKDIDGFVQIIIAAVGTVWAVVEAIMGYFTNKEAKPTT